MLNARKRVCVAEVRALPRYRRVACRGRRRTQRESEARLKAGVMVSVAADGVGVVVLVGGCGGGVGV